MNLLTMLFSAVQLISPEQIAIIIAIVAVAILFVVGNVCLSYYYYKTAVRKLCTRQLQERRESLLKELDELRAQGKITPEEEPDIEEEPDEDENEEFDDEDETDAEPLTEQETVELSPETIAVDEGGYYNRLRIMAVSEMSPLLRERNGLVGDEYDGKSYYVRCAYSFEAKLRCGSDFAKSSYVSLLNELALYHGLKIADGAKQRRIYRGRKTLGVILFRGKTLYLALALDPKTYAKTKYRGKDMSDSKRFEKTPMLLRLSSARKLEYAKYLLTQLAEAHTIVMEKNPKTVSLTFDSMTDNELYEHDLLKLTLLGEVKAQ